MDSKAQLKSLKARHDKLLTVRAERSAEAKLKREELARLIEEMRAAGVSPETLEEEYKKAKQDLDAALATFEKELSAAEKAYNLV